MQLATKAQIAKATLSLLTAVASVTLLGVLVIVLCAGLGINPFRETTTTFLLSLFSGLIGIGVLFLLVNVATNISLIADATAERLGIQPHSGFLRKWFIVFLGTAAALTVLVFVGTYFSKERYLKVVRSQADEVLEDNRESVQQISRLLASGQPEDYKKVGDISTFLDNQRSGLPRLTLIYSGKFGDKLAFYSVPDYFPQDKDGKYIYTPNYFPCTKSLDCDYLKTFFSGQKVDALEKYTLRDDQFYIYIPVTGLESRFVLLFNRANSYGKIGS